MSNFDLITDEWMIEHTGISELLLKYLEQAELIFPEYMEGYRWSPIMIEAVKKILMMKDQNVSFLNIIDEMDKFYQERNFEI